MGLTAKDRIGAYEIVALLGAGGMGEVYRARDTRLKRDVALKVLPDAVNDDPDRLARFRREAELLAGLTHSNIAAVYGLEESDDRHAIVMELVDGHTLADLIAARGGHVPIGEALSIARQIAEAIEAAHDRGVIHRDLKPANIKVQRDGRVKVLDFGLAKLLEPPTAASTLSHSPTLTVDATLAGVILGTAAYMSPEQARGRDVDRRTDIWSFGCVLFEMLTGKQVFAASGDTVSDVVAAILRGDPDWSSLPAATPDGIRRLLRRCLAKDPRERLHDIADARLEIDDASRGSVQTGSPLPGLSRRSTGAALAVTAALAAIVVLLAVPAVLYFVQRAPERLVTHLELAVPASIGVGSGGFPLALSPDGRQLAFVATGPRTTQLWVRPLDQTTARPLPGTEGARDPFWAPDGRTIAFFGDGKLKRIELTGGQAQVIADAPASAGGTWGVDGTIVFAPTERGLMRVPSVGGMAVAVTRVGPDQRGHRYPQFLPDGQRFLFFAIAPGEENRGTYVGSLEGSDPVRLLANEYATSALPDKLLLFRNGTLTALPFDASRAVTTGDALSLTEITPVSYFSASATGVLAYLPDLPSQRRQLVWRDRAGRSLGTVGQPDEANSASLELAPDGRRVATARTTQANMDVWVFDVSRGVPSRLTFTPRLDSAPVWSPDGQRVAFRSNRAGTGILDLFEKPSSGAGDEQPLLVTSETKTAYAWSPDGRMLLYGTQNPDTGADIWALPLEGDRKPVPVVQTSAAEDAAQFSPDGRWVAYESNETGRFEIYVQAFPTPRGKWQVSSEGGVYPRWRPDGKELFYIAADGRLTANPVVVDATGQSIETGAPVALFAPRLASGLSIVQPGGLARPLYAVAADGRFLVNEAAEDDAATTAVRVVLNWDAGRR